MHPRSVQPALRATLAAFALAALPLAALAIPHAGDVAPAFSLTRADTGGAQTLAALKGKPIYLNFFASWCGPCNEEAPSVVSLYKRYHSRGLVTLGVNELESKDKALEFGKKYGVPFELVLDDGGKMGKDYGALALPVHVFIAPDGKISTYRLGEMSPGEIEDAIKKIVASTPPKRKATGK